MKLTVERMPESQVRLDISADEDEFAKAMDRAYRKVSREMRIPGFRPGKAPRQIIERMFGREIFLEEAHKQIMEDLYRRALDQEQLVPVGDPRVDIVVAEPIEFRVEVPVYPTVDPGPYQDARVEPVDAAVDEAAVEEVVERLRKAQSPWVDPAEPRTPREGDQVTIDLKVEENGEPFRGQEPTEDAVFILGESNLLEPLRAQIEQMQVGETANLEILFAEDDETVSPEVRGKTLTYTITLKGVKERDLLPLDDEFAKTAADEETLDGLRQAIRDDLHRDKTATARTEAVNEIIDKMAEGATIELPPVMIDQAVDDDLKSLRARLANQGQSLEEHLRRQDQTEDELKAELRPTAERRLRNTLLLREIAKREDIAVSDADVAAEVDRLTAPAENPERLRDLYGSDYFRGLLRGDLFERRITDRLIEIATEGRGAVVNGWVEPEPEAASQPTADAVVEVEAQAEEAGVIDVTPAPGADSGGPAVDTGALDQALTTGAMTGQPGDVAAVATTEGDGLPGAQAADEPDAAQAAAVAHEAENAAVAAAAPADAVTPEERETQGKPGAGGVLADPDY